MCVELRQCPYIANLLSSATISKASVMKIMKQNMCALQGQTPFVCCQKSTALDTTTTQVPAISRPTSAENIMGSKDKNSPIEPKNNSNNTLDSIIRQHPNFNLLPNNICGPIATDSRITSGSKATLNEYPWMALIAYDIDGGVDFRCGGTVINQRYILTAAHCISNETIIGVRLGEYDLDTINDCDKERGYCASPTQDFYAEKLIIHPDYNSKTFENDIALIRLATSANFSCDNVQPICLPSQDEDLTGQFVTVSGWGVTEEGFKSSQLLKVSLPVRPVSTCQSVYNRFAPITPNQICAGGYKGRDSCGGDSGGPLTTVNQLDGSPKYIQYGIVSYGPRHCGTEGKPGIYTRVYTYMTWILDSMQPWED